MIPKITIFRNCFPVPYTMHRKCVLAYLYGIYSPTLKLFSGVKYGIQSGIQIWYIPKHNDGPLKMRYFH